MTKEALLSHTSVQSSTYVVIFKDQSHTAKTHESRANYAQIFVSARSLRRMRNSSADRTLTVSDCKWMCIEAVCAWF